MKNPVNPLRVGDQIFEIQGKTVDKYKGGVQQIRQLIKDEEKIAVLAQRSDPDASSISTDSEYDGWLEGGGRRSRSSSTQKQTTEANEPVEESASGGCCSIL